MFVEKGLLTYVNMSCVGVKKWYTNSLVLKKKTKNGPTKNAIVTVKTARTNKPPHICGVTQLFHFKPLLFFRFIILKIVQGTQLLVCMPHRLVVQSGCYRFGHI